MARERETLQLQGLKRGDLASFRWVYDQNHGKIYGFALKLIGSPEIAEEITSDVFVKLWEKRAQIDTSYTISSLLFKITRDFVWNQIKKEKRIAAQKLDYLLTRGESLDIDPDSNLIYQDFLKIAEEGIALLPEKRRAAFNLRYKLGLQNEEIAQQLNISESTVRVHLSKAVQFLRDHLQSHPDFMVLLYLCWFS
jgi:RNA polymerase sigma-70 factor (ECF subfamily)